MAYQVSQETLAVRLSTLTAFQKAHKVPGVIGQESGGYTFITTLTAKGHLVEISQLISKEGNPQVNIVIDGQREKFLFNADRFTKEISSLFLKTAFGSADSSADAIAAVAERRSALLATKPVAVAAPSKATTLILKKDRVSSPAPATTPAPITIAEAEAATVAAIASAKTVPQAAAPDYDSIPF